MKESNLMKEIELYVSSLGHIPLRMNTGVFKTNDNRIIKCGIKGMSDLLIILRGGKSCWIETKVHPRKPTPEQLNFIRIMREMGALAGVVYNLEDLKKLLQTY